MCKLLAPHYASTSPLSFYNRMPFLPPNQQRQSTEGIFNQQLLMGDFMYFAVETQRRDVCNQKTSNRGRKRNQLISVDKRTFFHKQGNILHSDTEHPYC